MFGFSRANIFLGNKDDSSNKDIFGATNSSETKKHVYDRSGKSSGNANVENVDLDEDFIDNSSLGADMNEDDFSSNQYSEYILNQYMNKYGDVDGDGVISIKDVTTIQQQLANNGISSNGAGDVNCDGKVDDNDIALIQQYLSGNVITPTNIEMANKMDVIKYSHIRSQTANELRDKNMTLQKIKNSIGYHELDDEIKTKQENSHGNRLIKNKEKGYMHYVNKNNNSNTNTNNSINRNPFGSSEAGQKKNTLYNIYKNNKLTAAEEEALIKEFGSLAAAQSAYEMNIASLNYSKKELDKQIDLVPYNNLMNTADFKKWANNKYISDFDPNNNPDLANSSKYIASYKYLSAGQLAMYNYLLDTKSKEEADKYIDLYQDDINKAIGLERANKFINQLDKDFSKIIREDGSLMDDTDMKKLQNLLDKNQYDKSYDINGDGKLTDEDMSKLKQYIETGGEIESTFKNMGITFGGGFQDGWNKFFEGFKYVFDDSAVLSPEEYKMMFIAQKLEQNGVIKSSYEFGQTVGNMTPVILASAIATAATAPFGGEGGAAVFGTSLSAQQIGQYTAAALIFTSTYGNSKHEALCNGHSLESAIGFASLSGLSEAGLETLLGSIPGVGKECKNIFVGMFKEGLSESAQELVGSMIGYYTLGEEIDVSDLSAGMGKAFIYGALLSGASNGFSSGLKIVVNGVKYTLTSQQIMDYYNASIDPVTGENNGLSIQEYVEKNVDSNSYPDYSNLDVDGLEITAELPRLQSDDGLEVTAELPKLQIENNYSSEYYANTDPEFNALEMKNEINSFITPEMNTYQTARSLYIELNKRLSYDADYLNGTSETKAGIYNTELSFENLKDSNVICKGWSELYRELLIDNGFDENSVRVLGDGESMHRWVEITLPDGNVIIADGTETIGSGSGRANDLANCKIGAATNGFVYAPGEYSGQRIKTNPALIKAGNTQWADIDNGLGYNSDGLYYDDKLALANDFFGEKGEPKSYGDKVKALVDMEIPPNLDGVECLLYYRKLKHTFFNNFEINNIDTKIKYNKVGDSYEGVAILEIGLGNGEEQYVTYSESTGKHVFDNESDYYDFLRTLKYY